MKRFGHPQIAELAHELTLSPLRLRLRQVAGISHCLELLEADREYPYSFVCFQITGYRSRRTADSLISGKELIEDLVELLDALTEATPLPSQAAFGSLFESEDLARRFKVSTKTISRWRKRGLAGCWYQGESAKPRFAYSRAAVERFVARNLELVRRGASFQLMNDQERELIIARARELVASERISLHLVTLRLAEETGRAVETIRYTLRRYDKQNPTTAMFDRSEQPQVIEEGEVIAQAFAAGDDIATLAERFGRRESEIRSLITEQHARALAAKPIDYIYHQIFDASGAEDEILGEAPMGIDNGGVDETLTRIPSELPPYLQALYRTPLLAAKEEAFLFRQMNYLLHQAELLRQRTVVENVASGQSALRAGAGATEVSRIHDLLERAAAVKNRIIQANLRLVVSIAKRHLYGKKNLNLFELVSDGNVALMRAVDKFDFGRGFRFSTYGSWAIIRCFARSVPEELAHDDRFQTGHEETLSIAPDRVEISEATVQGEAQELRLAVADGLSMLDERERTIVESHFGISAEGEGKTLDQIGRDLGLSKERVRQIERRALGKLRMALADREELLAG